MSLMHKVTKRVDLPDEPGQWIEMRMPSLAILERAQRARQREALAMFIEFDLSRVQGLSRPETERQDAEDYDWQSLLISCIIAWSYTESLTPENIAELDAATVKLLVATLLPAESKEDQKKGSGSSTKR